MNFLAGMQAANLWPLAGIFGLLVGSFINVIAWRWYRSKLPRPLALKTRSQCVDCGKLLAWYELIPLVSFFVQRARCRNCGKRLSWRYPVTELLMAVIFAATVAIYGAGLQSVVLLVLASLLIVIALIDSETQLIPDQLSALALGITILGLVGLQLPNLIVRSSAIVSTFSYAIPGLLIGAGILGIIVLITRGRGMGVGDIKLVGVLGLSLGGPAILLALFSAFVSGAIFGVILLSRGKASMKTAVPFGPFLVLGWLVSLLWGHSILPWYTGLN